MRLTILHILGSRPHLKRKSSYFTFPPKHSHGPRLSAAEFNVCFPILQKSERGRHLLFPPSLRNSESFIPVHCDSLREYHKVGIL